MTKNVRILYSYVLIIYNIVQTELGYIYNRTTQRAVNKDLNLITVSLWSAAI